MMTKIPRRANFLGGFPKKESKAKGKGPAQTKTRNLFFPFGLQYKYHHHHLYRNKTVRNKIGNEVRFNLI